MTGLISIVSGVFIFAGIFLSYRPLSQRVMEYLNRTVDSTQKTYRDLFVIKESSQVRRELLMLAAVVFLFSLGLVGLSPAGVGVGLVLGFYCIAWPQKYYSGVMRAKRINQFTSQMVDALTLMANGLRSGLNMAQSLQNVVDEMDGPVRQEFGLVLSENKLGVTFERALENMADRLHPSEDVRMFVTSVNILRETGGNIAETFDTITTTIRERIKLKNKIDAMTAQGRSSALIVGGLPWGIGLVLYVLDPKNMTLLFVTPQGWAILAGVLALEFIGFIVISKIVAIKV